MMLETTLLKSWRLTGLSGTTNSHPGYPRLCTLTGPHDVDSTVCFHCAFFFLLEGRWRVIWANRGGSLPYDELCNCDAYVKTT